MATIGVLAGEASVAINGTSYDLFGSLEYSPSGVDQETIKGQGGVFGVKQNIKEGEATMVVMDNGAMYVGAFNGLLGASIVCILANGKSVVLNNAWTVGFPTVNTVEGTFEVKLASKSLTEIPTS